MGFSKCNEVEPRVVGKPKKEQRPAASRWVSRLALCVSETVSGCSGLSSIACSAARKVGYKRVGARQVAVGSSKAFLVASRRAMKRRACCGRRTFCGCGLPNKTIQLKHLKKAWKK